MILKNPAVTKILCHAAIRSWMTKLRTRQNRIYWIAIMVLNDIVVHYRAKPHLDKETGQWKLKKRFKHGLYHLYRPQLGKKLEVVPVVITRALGYLEKVHKIITRHYDRKICGFMFRENIFVELHLDALEKLCKQNLSEDQTDQAVAHDQSDQKVAAVVTRKSLPKRPGSHSRSDQKVAHTGEDSKQEKTETKDIINTKASQATPVAGDIHPDSEDRITESNQNDSSRKKQLLLEYIENELKRRHIQYDANHSEIQIPNGFRENVCKVCKQLRWSATDFVHTVSFSWVHAEYYEQEDGSTFDGAFYSKLCGDSLNKLFKVDKDGGLYIQNIASNKELGYDPQNFETPNTPENDEIWWTQLLQDKGTIDDPDKYYDQDGRGICDPNETTWVGIKRVLENWLLHQQPNREPKKNWLDAVIQRFKREPTGPKDGMFRDDYAAVKGMLIQRKLLPENFGAVPADSGSATA